MMQTMNNNGQVVRRFKGSDDVFHQSRASRMNHSIQIRKEKTNQRKMTRRLMSQQVQMVGADHAQIERAIQQCTDAYLLWKQDPMTNLPTFFEGIKGIREVLSIEGEVDAAVSAILSAGVLAFLYDALDYEADPNLQQEAAWAITNIASTSRTQDVAEFPGMPYKLVKWLSQGTTPELREYCAWSLGNIAGHSKDYREGLLKIDGIHSGLALNLLNPASQPFLENVMWATAGLVTESWKLPPQLTLAFVQPTIQVLARSDTNDRIQADACRALWSLAEGEADDGRRVNDLLKYNVVNVLDQVLEHQLTRQDRRDCSVLMNLVKCYGMVALGTEEQCQCVVDSHFMKCLPKLMNIESKSLQKETTWTCSNIAAGSIDQARALSSRHKALRMIADASISKHHDVRRESLWTLCNMLMKKDECMTEAVLQAGGTAAICANLQIHDVDLLLHTLESLEVMLEYNRATNGTLLDVLYDEEGIDKLEQLQEHKNDKVYEKVVYIIDTFIGSEPGLDDDDFDLCPETNGDSYQFGVPKKLFSEGHTFDFSMDTRDHPALGGRF